LAGALAHAIAHIAFKHFENEFKAREASRTLMENGLKYAAADGKIDPAAADLALDIAMGYLEMTMKGYNKAELLQADREGTLNIYLMGYNPYGLYDVIEFLDKIKKNKKVDGYGFSSDRSAYKKRMKKIEAFIKKQGMDTSRSYHEKRFMEFKAEHPI
jgi:predicted Zn-dependent protease